MIVSVSSCRGLTRTVQSLAEDVRLLQQADGVLAAVGGGEGEEKRTSSGGPGRAAGGEVEGVLAGGVGCEAEGVEEAGGEVDFAGEEAARGFLATAIKIGHCEVLLELVHNNNEIFN